MAQVIIFQNPNNTNVCVCYPTGEVDINTVLKKDCPPGAQIVDSSILPQGSDAQFFDAWVLNGSTITVNIQKAISDYLNNFNACAVLVAQKRNANTIAGINNSIDDVTWLNNLNSARASIQSSTTTAELLAIPFPT